MRLQFALVLFLTGLLTGCSSFRPVSTVRNPSRAPRTNPTVQHRAPRERTPAPPPRVRTRTTTPAPRPAPRHAPAASGPTAVVRNQLVSEAEGLLGIRYKYGGNTPREGFDCSGFVKYLYNDQGLDIQRVSRDQARQGKEIDPSRAKPGDLVFYRRGANQPVFHVSMIVDSKPGEIWVIHPTSSRGVIRENILASSYWKPKIYAVKDLIR